METSVPRRGRARRIGSGAEDDVIGDEQAAHAVGHMAAGQRSARNIVNLLAEPQWLAWPLSNKLRAPCGIAHLAAEGFAIVQNFDAAHRAVGVEAECERDELMLADNL